MNSRLTQCIKSSDFEKARQALMKANVPGPYAVIADPSWSEKDIVDILTEAGYGVVEGAEAVRKKIEELSDV